MYMCAYMCVYILFHVLECFPQGTRAWAGFLPAYIAQKGTLWNDRCPSVFPFLSFLLSINHLHFQLINTQIRLITVFWNRLPPQNYDVSFLSTFSYFNSFVYSYASPFQFLQIMVHMRWTVTFTLIKTNPKIQPIRTYAHAYARAYKYEKWKEIYVTRFIFWKDFIRLK